MPGQTIVEPSSGNTGIALAAIAQIKGYPIKILMPTSVSIERRQMLEVFGAELILTPGEEGTQRCGAPSARRWPPSIPSGASSYQYGNDANPSAHYEGTGPEILRDVPEITHFVAGLGTSGTLMGTGRVPQGAEARRQDHRRRAAARRAGRGPAQPRRRLHPAGVRDVARHRGARPQARRAASRVARVDPPPRARMRHLRRHLERCGAWPARPRSRQRDRGGHDRVHRVRRRLEVPLDRRLHRRPRRGREPRPNRSSTSDRRCRSSEV